MSREDEIRQVLTDLYEVQGRLAALFAQEAEIRRTRDREIARMARDSGINALIRFAEMLEADAPS